MWAHQLFQSLLVPPLFAQVWMTHRSRLPRHRSVLHQHLRSLFASPLFARVWVAIRSPGLPRHRSGIHACFFFENCLEGIIDCSSNISLNEGATLSIQTRPTSSLLEDDLSALSDGSSLENKEAIVPIVLLLVDIRRTSHPIQMATFPAPGGVGIPFFVGWS